MSFTPEWATDYVCRLQSVLKHQNINEFIESQVAIRDWWASVFVFFRRWILTFSILNFVHARVFIQNKLHRFCVTTTCFVGMCLAMGEFDAFALACFAAFNFVTIFASDL